MLGNIIACKDVTSIGAADYVVAYQDNVELANGIGGKSIMFRNIIRSLKTRIFWEECYKRQEEKGISIFGMCGGKLNPVEDKIDDECQDCTYYVGKK